MSVTIIILKMMKCTRYVAGIDLQNHRKCGSENMKDTDHIKRHKPI